MAGMNLFRAKELIEQRKVLSDIKNDTDRFTFPEKESNNKCTPVRNKKDDLEMIGLLNTDNTSYFLKLFYEC